MQRAAITPTQSQSTHRSQAPMRTKASGNSFSKKMEQTKRARPEENQKGQQSQKKQETKEGQKKQKTKKDQKTQEGPQKPSALSLQVDPMNTLHRQLLGMRPPGIGAQSGMQIAAPKAPPQGWINQVVDTIHAGVDATGQSMCMLEMKSGVLDGLKIQLRVDKGALHAQFISENPEIRKLLDENTQKLERSLKAKGLIIGALETKDPKEEQRQQKREQHQKDRQAFNS